MDPTLKFRTISMIKGRMEQFSPRKRKAAKYILDHMADFGLDPIRETARKAGVSTYTLVRMARDLGFESFDALRDPFRHALVSSPGLDEMPDWLAQLPQRGETGRTEAQSAANTLAIVQRSLQLLTPDLLDRTADTLLGAKRVYVTGARASYSMAYYFHYVGRMALTSLDLIPRHVGSAIDELNLASDADVLLAISTTPYSRETIDACRFAQSRGMALVMIADSEIVAPDLRPDITLLVSSVSTHHFACYSGIAAVLEALLSVLLRKGGPETAGRIASYERLRNDHSAYWRP